MIATMKDTQRGVFERLAGISLPRHVSYPMPTWWHDVSGDEASAMLADGNAQLPGYDLSLYLHIPFCESLCKFCACNKVIQRHDANGAADRTEAYVEAIQAEIRGLAQSIDSDRPMRQIHYGGGTPTYLTPEQMARVHGAVVGSFTVASDAEVAIEIDPRTATSEKLSCLRWLGFNRISMGVQDFDAQVQQHVRRIQPIEMVRDVVSTCRSLGFPSVNFDLIYGMPHQTVETIRDTIARTIELAPDRIAYYHYAQIPEKIATQRGMDYTKLPDSNEKLEMFLAGIELFEQAGYRFVGLDHFAKADEALSEALDEGTIQRNFQGMTTGAGLRLLGVGVSSISHLPEVGFLQNCKDTNDYVARIQSGRTPVERGKRLTFDDRVRQAVIDELYCTAALQPTTIEKRFDITFADYFPREMGIMTELERDGLLTIESNQTIRATQPLGRVLMRNIAAVFDAYLDPTAYFAGEKACFSANA